VFSILFEKPCVMVKFLAISAPIDTISPEFILKIYLEIKSTSTVCVVEFILT
jgi:hypothetical protein